MDWQGGDIEPQPIPSPPSQIAFFLDYDGTLTPIVENPSEAKLSEEARSVVRALSARYPTAIVSGRARATAEGLVQLQGIYYAGSHGFDILGPNGSNYKVRAPCPYLLFSFLILCTRHRRGIGAASGHLLCWVPRHRCFGAEWVQLQGDSLSFSGVCFIPFCCYHKLATTAHLVRMGSTVGTRGFQYKAASPAAPPLPHHLCYPRCPFPPARPLCLPVSLGARIGQIQDVPFPFCSPPHPELTNPPESPSFPALTPSPPLLFYL
jgi:hypothetical protein